MECTQVSGTLELVSRYSRRDEGQGERCHEQAEEESGEDTECDGALPAAATLNPCMPAVAQNNAFSIQRRIIAESIEKNNAGRPYNRLDLSASINYSPNSSGFRQLITSSSRYGLTEGSYMAEKISLTALGRSIVSPTTEKEKQGALRGALTYPELFNKILNYYNNKNIPKEDLLKNALKREFHVRPEDVDVCYNVLAVNIKDFSLSQDIKGNSYLQLEKLSPPSTSDIEYGSPPEMHSDMPPQPDDVKSGQLAANEDLPRQPKSIFIAHGKNRKPLDQLKSILSQFKVPYEVAGDEPHRGRVISQKVAETMRKCTSGIFIFTADEEVTDAQGSKSFRPSDNVVFELGAGMVLYDSKIVILREREVTFGSDFTNYGHITFDRDQLDAKAWELMKELIGLGFLEVMPK